MFQQINTHTDNSSAQTIKTPQTTIQNDVSNLPRFRTQQNSDFEDFSLSVTAVQAGHTPSQPWTTATCPPLLKHHLTCCFSSTWPSPSPTDEPASWRLDPARYIARRPEPRACHSSTPALGRRRCQSPQALASRERVIARNYSHHRNDQHRRCPGQST